MRNTGVLFIAAMVVAAGCNKAPDADAPAETAAPAPAAAPAAPPPETPGSNEFEMWFVNGPVTVASASVDAPDGTRSADAISFGPDGGMNRPYPQNPIAAGQTVKASIYLWGEEGKRVVFYISRSCDASAAEGTSSTITLTPQPQKHELEYTFQSAHACVALELKGADGAHTVNGWKANLTF
jgi:hypothetical protein